MAGAYLYGWDSVNSSWVKLVCTNLGKLIIDPSEIFEDPPTDGEAGKAATSNWSHDHNANADAHHTKFTVTEHDTAARHPLANLDTLVCSEAEADSKITTHKGDASAHHTKYTDAEARTAVGYNGTKYWSLSGVGFDAQYPATDSVWKSNYGHLEIITAGITLNAPVTLPHGAVVTGVIIYGNTSAESKFWILARFSFTSRERETMASGYINAANSSILFATIDNSNYHYYFYLQNMGVEDGIYGARITYTI